jgi:hypothetical protein
MRAHFFSSLERQTMVGPIRTLPLYEGYMDLGEAARLFAVDRATIRRRLHAQGRSLYANPTDQRLRMIKEEDLRAIFRIVPAPQRTRSTASSAG